MTLLTAPRGPEQRATVRFDASMPVSIEGCGGTTHNVSAQGVYFESEVPQLAGSLVNFTIEYRLYGRSHRLLCEGKVVRVEAQDGRHGIAARLIAPFFDGEEIVVPAPLP